MERYGRDDPDAKTFSFAPVDSPAVQSSTFRLLSSSHIIPFQFKKDGGVSWCFTPLDPGQQLLPVGCRQLRRLHRPPGQQAESHPQGTSHVHGGLHASYEVSAQIPHGFWMATDASDMFYKVTKKSGRIWKISMEQDL